MMTVMTESWDRFYEHFEAEEEAKSEDYYLGCDFDNPETLKGWNEEHILELQLKVVDGLFDHLKSLGYEPTTQNENEYLLPLGEWRPFNFLPTISTDDFVLIHHECPDAWFFMEEAPEKQEIEKWLGIKAKFITHTAHNG